MKPLFFALATLIVAAPIPLPALAQPMAPLTQIQTRNVFIGGEVRRPGTYQVPANGGLASLFALAGGATDEAVLEKVMLTRGGIAMPLNLLDAFKAAQAGFAFQNGDSLLVPRRELRISIAGAVKNPGRYVIPEAGISVADALALAGGARDTTRQIEVMRLTRAQNPVSQRGASPFQTPVAPGTLLGGDDVIVVREVKTTRDVFILGEIRNSGMYPLPMGDNLASLLKLAGGAKPEAALSQIQVRRNTRTFTVNLLEALKPGSQVSFLLQDGDVVTVPRNENRVFVSGAVKNTGSYAIPERGTLSVAQALALAGGITAKGDSEISLIERPAKIKADDPTPPAVFRTVKPDYILQPGDIIYVSEARKPGNPNSLYRLLNFDSAQ